MNVAEKIDQVRRPQDKFVFVEEDALSHGQYENVGSFILMQNNNPDLQWMVKGYMACEP